MERVRVLVVPCLDLRGVRRKDRFVMRPDRGGLCLKAKICLTAEALMKRRRNRLRHHVHFTSAAIVF